MSSRDLRPLLGAALLAACAPPDAAFAPLATVSMARVEAPTVTGITTVATGDLDGDGDIDRVEANTTTFQPFLNDGAGHFTPGALFLAPNATGVEFPGLRRSGFEVGDFDGDGYGDILAWSAITLAMCDDINEPWTCTPDEGVGGMRVAYGSAAGPQPQLLIDRTTEVALTGVRFAGDVDGDGDEDLAATYRSTWFVSYDAPQSAEYFDLEQRHVGRVPHFFLRGATERPAVVAGDVQQDGYADDLVGANGPSGVRWRAGGPDGRPTTTGPSPDWVGEYAYTGLIVQSWTADWSWSPPAEPYDALFPEARGRFVQGIDDVNADGFRDMVVIEQVGRPHIDWFAGAPDGYGAGPVGTLVSESADQLYNDGVVAADFDGDGAREVIALVTTRGYQELLLFFSPGPGLTGPYRTLSASGDTLRAPGDVNNDGFEDLLVGTTLVYGGPVTCPGGPVQTWYPDSDGDGYASSAHALQVCSQPAGASATPGADCNDVDNTVHPGAAETPRGVDKNCDGVVVGGLDLDGDRYITGTIDLTTYECPPKARYSATGDCDDDNDDVSPSAYEAIGTLADTNCSGTVRCYTDADGDGLGTSVQITVPGTTCANPAGGVAPVSGDCDDADPVSGPTVNAYVDADGDGWGGTATRITGCLPSGRVTWSGDCNDSDPAISPGATEVLGGTDENCNTRGHCYTDQDDDGYGAGALVDVTDAACGVGLATLPDDCDDTNPYRNPGLPEQPGGVDEDCDGLTTACGVEVPGGGDEDCDGLGLCFVDTDRDGWGSSTLITTPWVQCDGPQMAGQTGDCADNVARRNPGAAEEPGGTDENCDGITTCYVDLDGDGAAQDTTPYPSPDPSCRTRGFATFLGDCDDTDPARSPDQAEIDGNLVDENCDGLTSCYADNDRDGAGDAFARGVPVGQVCPPPLLPRHTDCDGGDPNIYQGAPEIPGNGLDEDCDREDLFALHVRGLIQNNRRFIRATVTGPPPGTSINIYAGRSEGVAYGPCPLAGQICGDLLRPFVWATGTIGADGRLVITRADPNPWVYLQAFTVIHGRVGKSMVDAWEWGL